MAKAYFNISGLLDMVKANTGQTVKLSLSSIKVGGVEQLTPAFFSEVIPTFVQPYTVVGSGNLWNFGLCSQTGSYPSATSITSCSSLYANSFNPFQDAFKVNYSDTVDSRARGEITTSVSSSFYGLEPFKFGFDKIDVPVNDVVGGGSTGATIQGCFYLDIDYTQDFEMLIDVQIKDNLGTLIYDSTHHYFHDALICQFDYDIIEGGYVPVSETYFGTITTDSQNWQFVDAGNGFAYASAGRSGTFLKLEIATGNLTTFGSFLSGVAPQYTNGILNTSNGKIYFMSASTGALDVLVLDTSNDTYSTFGTFISGIVPNPFGGLTITPTGIIYATSTAAETFFKIDTNLETITTLTKVGATGGGTANYSSNGFVYFVSRFGEFYKLDTSTDIITTVVEPLILNLFNDSYIDSNGDIFGVCFIGGSSYVTRLETLNSDTVSSTLISSSNSNGFVNISQMTDSNPYLINVLDGDVYRLDISNYVPSNIYTIANIYSYLPTTAIGDSIYSIPTGVGQEILKLEFDNVINTTNSKPTAFLSGGNSGWIAPYCSLSTLPTDSPIVTQSICTVAQSVSTPINVFGADFIKQCCYFSPVLAHPVDTDSFKNDKNAFVFQRSFASESIDFVLLKNGGLANGGTDIPLVDNTYGDYGNFGFAGTTNKKAYVIDWQKVLNVEGEGSYQLQTTLNLITGTSVKTSLVFKLKTYTDERAKGTVRIESEMSGYLKHLDFDYENLKFKDQIRVKGFFGNRQAEYENEQIIYQNRLSRQLRSEMINTYTLQTLHIPSCVTDLIIEYHNFANVLKITDYNTVNHKKDYVDKQVVFDSMEDIEYKSVTDKAPLTIKYKDYLQNFQKNNC